MRRVAPIDAAAERRQAEAVGPYLRCFRQVREVRLAAFALLAAFTHRGRFLTPTAARAWIPPRVPLEIRVLWAAHSLLAVTKAAS